MMQPFERFTISTISQLIRLERFYLVSQTYTRKESEKHVLLLTDYNELGGAKIHLNAVKGDRWAAIINLQNEVHKAKLEEMTSEGSRYEVYFAVVHSAKVLENKLAIIYKDRLKKYISRETNWRMERSGKINVTLQLTFGELFIIIKNFSQQIRVRLAEIEAMAI